MSGASRVRVVLVLASVLASVSASTSALAAPDVCVGASAQRALRDLQGKLAQPRPSTGAGLTKAAAGVFRRYRSTVERTSRAGPDQWLFSHYGAPLWITVQRPATTSSSSQGEGDAEESEESEVAGAPMTVTACVYSVTNGRLDAVSPGQIVKGFRETAQRTLGANDVDGVVALSGLGGFSFDAEWRGPRLVTLLLVRGQSETPYQLQAQTSPPPVPATASSLTP